MTNNSKLDEKIKQSLSNYKANDSVPEWTRMEKMLDVTPQTSTFRRSYILGSLAIVAVIGGGYLFYNNFNASKTIEKTVSTAPVQPINTNSNSVVTNSEINKQNNTT